MKRCLCLLITAGFIAAATVTHAAAPIVSVGSVRGFPGVTVEVPLRLKLDSNAPVAVVALQADLVFDGSRAQLGTVSRGTAASNHVLRTHVPAPGVQRVLLYSTLNQPLTNGTLASVPFVIAPGNNVANIPISLNNVVLASAVGTAIARTTSQGAIVMSPVYRRPDGIVDLFLNVQPNQNYLVQSGTNLIDWFNFSTNESLDPLLFLIDENAVGFPHRFYRAIPLDP
jgi:hypothetical protein